MSGCAKEQEREARAAFHWTAREGLPGLTLELSPEESTVPQPGGQNSRQREACSRQRGEPSTEGPALGPREQVQGPQKRGAGGLAV